MTPLSRECLIHFLNKYAKDIKGPVADYGGAGKWGKEVKRILASGKVTDYTALDYATGYDLTKPIRGRKFQVGICMDLLEHVANPFLVATNITNSLKPGALFFITAPFIWGFHEFPKDYFRFTVDGMKSVFSSMKCLEAQLLTDTAVPLTPAVDVEINKLNQKLGASVHTATRVVAIFRKVSVK